MTRSGVPVDQQLMKVNVDAGAYPTIRNHSVGRVSLAGFVDELDGGVTVNGLTAHPLQQGRGRTRDSGSGTPPRGRRPRAASRPRWTLGRGRSQFDGVSANGTVRPP
jgi:hypothetical protein